MPNFQFCLMVTSDVALAVAHSLERRLSSAQTVFPFRVHSEPLYAPSGPEASIRAEVLESRALDVARARYPLETPVLITGLNIDDGSFTSFDETVAVVSVYHWRQDGFSDYPQERFLMYTVADILMNIFVDTPVHWTVQQCVGDYCENPAEINASLATCEYCVNCRRLISAAVNGGEISTRELAAIYRILDAAAERKRIFVLMPFARRFDSIYQTIRDTVCCCGWECYRADDIRHTREIINVIWEEVERSECLIADLTGLNPSVFYELGYAHAIRRNTILLTQALRTLPFDLRHRGVIEYHTTPAGKKDLADALRMLLR